MKDNIKLLKMAVTNSIYYFLYEKLFIRSEKLKKKSDFSQEQLLFGPVSQSIQHSHVLNCSNHGALS